MNLLTYYKKISQGIRINKPEDIFLLLQMKWRGIAISEDLYLKVNYCVGPDLRANIIDTKFKVSGIYFDASATTPYRKATLWLESKLLYALLELDTNDPTYGNSIILSPVPFGMDGKPKLPYTKDQINALMYVVARIMDSPKTTGWTAAEITEEVCALNTAMVWFLEEQAVTCLAWLEKLHVIERKPDG